MLPWHERRLLMNFLFVSRWKDSCKATSLQLMYTCHLVGSPWLLNGLSSPHDHGRCILNGSSTANWGEKKAARKKEVSVTMKPSKQRPGRRIALAEGAAVLVALGFDLLGEPPAAWHPVVWSGKLIWRLERAAPQGHVPQLLYGLAMLALAAPAATLPAATAHRLAKRVQLEAIQRGHAYGGLILYALIE